MSEINPITSISCEKMTGTGVHHVEHSKKSRDPSFEHLWIYDRTHSEQISRGDIALSTLSLPGVKLSLQALILVRISNFKRRKWGLTHVKSC